MMRHEKSFILTLSILISLAIFSRYDQINNMITGNVVNANIGMIPLEVYPWAIFIIALNVILIILLFHYKVKKDRLEGHSLYETKIENTEIKQEIPKSKFDEEYEAVKEELRDLKDPELLPVKLVKRKRIDNSIKHEEKIKEPEFKDLSEQEKEEIEEDTLEDVERIEQELEKEYHYKHHRDELSWVNEEIDKIRKNIRKK
jgi:hypothetical protein